MAMPEVSNSTLTTAPSEPEDEIFLEGPRSRFAEFFTLLRVMRDFLRGFRTLHFVGPCVTVFGSSRIKPDDPHYELARKMGAAIARLGFTVMTGGGPGHHGSGKPRRKRSRRSLRWLQHRACVRASCQPVSRSLRPDALLLRPQSAPREVFVCLCRHAWRRRHAR